MAEVALKSIKCAKVGKKQSTCCYLVLSETGLPRLDFTYRDGNGDQLTLQCENITAIDLRVEAKFGSIEAMKGTLLVECSVLQTTNPANNNSAPPSSEKSSKSCLVQGTFHVNETGAVRDLLRKLRSNHLSSNLDKTVSQPNNRQTSPKHYKEGLPSWVQFIPHYIYSKRTRQCIQLAIYIYLVFSIMWALWQLYRYVDVIREFVRPLIDMFQYQYQLVDYVIQFLNTLFEEYTIQWLCFIKPLCTVTAVMSAPLLQILGQLGLVLRMVMQIVTSSCTLLWPLVRPVLNIGYQLAYFLFTVIRALKNTLVQLWLPFSDISVPTIIGTYFKAGKNMLWALWHGLGQAQLDPIKAQLVIVRTTVIHSGKAVGLGMMRLGRKIYKFVWLRRSAQAEKEE